MPKPLSVLPEILDALINRVSMGLDIIFSLVWVLLLHCENSRVYLLFAGSKKNCPY